MCQIFDVSRKTWQAFSAYDPKLTIEGGYTHYNEQPSSVQLAEKLVDLNNAL